METKNEISDIPPWKKHLIARLRANRYGSGNNNGKLNTVEMVTVGIYTTDNNDSTNTITNNSSGPGACCSSTKTGVIVKKNQHQQHNNQLPLPPSTSSSSSPTSKDNNTKATAPSPGGRIPRTSDNSTSSSSTTRTKNRPLNENVNATHRARGKSEKSSNGPNDIEKMVQERIDFNSCESVDKMVASDYYKFDYSNSSSSSSTSSSSGSSEELHYGPGIVNKLKNKYLSLTLRRDNYTKQRPSILNLRKATSLENLLDNDVDEKPENRKQNEHFQKKTYGHINRSYYSRNIKRGTFYPENNMKRARSVETISRLIDNNENVEKIDDARQRPKSLHLNDILIINNDDDDKIKGKTSCKPTRKLPSPTNLILSTTTTTENDKNEKIQTTTPSTFVRKNINTNAKINRPKRIAPIMNEREKPPADVVKQTKMIFEKRPEQRTKPPINTGEVAAKVANFKNIIIQSKNTTTNPKKPPPIIKTTKPEMKNIQNHHREPPKVPKRKTPSNPITLKPDVSIVKNNNGKLCQTPDLILTTSTVVHPTPIVDIFDNDPIQNSESVSHESKPEQQTDELNKSSTNNEIVPFNEFIINDNDNQNNRKIFDDDDECSNSMADGDQKSDSIRKNDDNITRVNEKNMKNVEKNSENPPNINVADTDANESVVLLRDFGKNESNSVPKKVKRIPPKETESNSIVFKFTDRKDVPDYVQNDKTRIAAKLERPKVGEGGIILLRDPIIEKWLAEEEEEIKICLEAPPSPCNVSFINDNILIDGKSSINNKTKKTRMRISFVDSGPDIFEYPSESSYLIEEQDVSTPLINKSVPMLSGSSLANYTPKSTEEFQPGITRSIPTTLSETKKMDQETDTVEEMEQPVNFSEGTISDMLF